MTTHHGLTLFELSGRGGCRFSPYCWRSRYALAHKGLDARFEPVRFTGKEKISLSGHDRVPVLHDGTQWVGDSWEIACHIEDHYDGPSLFPGGRALARLVNDWIDTECHPLILRAIVGEIFSHLDAADRDYFRETRERRFGATIESVSLRQEEYLDRVRPKLVPFDNALREAPFLSGECPAYPDYVLAGTFEWVAKVSGAPIPEPRSRLSAWFERVRANGAAC